VGVTRKLESSIIILIRSRQKIFDRIPLAFALVPTGVAAEKEQISRDLTALFAVRTSDNNNRHQTSENRTLFPFRTRSFVS
jgi:hypothetical protein